MFIGREKGGNHGKFIGSNLVIFSYKEFENLRCANLLANRNSHLLFNLGHYILIHITYILIQFISSHFRLKSGHRNEKENYEHSVTEHIIYCPEDF